MSRFTVDFDREAEDRVESIREYLDASTKAEVIRKALKLLNFIVNEDKAGRTIFIEDPETNKRTAIVPRLQL